MSYFARPIRPSLPSRQQAAGLLLLTGFIFFVAAAASHTWGNDTMTTPSNSRLKIGLFAYCIDSVCMSWHLAPSDCNSASLFSDSNERDACRLLFAARAFIIMACIFSGVGAILLLAPRFILPSPSSRLSSSVSAPWPYKAGVTLSTVSFLCGLIGGGAGSRWVHSGVFQRGMAGTAGGGAQASAYIGWILALTAAVAGIVFNVRQPVKQTINHSALETTARSTPE